MAKASLSVTHLLERQRHHSRRCLRRCICWRRPCHTAGVEINKSSQPPLQHRVADKGPGCSWQQVYRQIERLPLKHGDPAAALADCCLTVLLLGHFEAPEPEGSMRTRHGKCSGITAHHRSQRNCPPHPHPSPKHSPETPRRNTHRGPTT